MATLAVICAGCWFLGVPIAIVFCDDLDCATREASYALAFLL